MLNLGVTSSATKERLRTHCNLRCPFFKCGQGSCKQRSEIVQRPPSWGPRLKGRTAMDRPRGEKSHPSAKCRRKGRGGSCRAV
ncbi:hypothetical protein RGR602_CH01506 [Rhizobium gallicum bv. gallicum R602sp]|uniref:Uncharacterized protein n=1 Tax=Rhizobium gallicum bv. gallicum R602sp TaxID=1041138 RepID=A0A0B4X2X4_9HYPH|nr:hypothetical protein RGR602_CH01506 [Rhizobium gallicum bv. gallicum R602sp]